MFLDDGVSKCVDDFNASKNISHRSSRSQRNEWQALRYPVQCRHILITQKTILQDGCQTRCILVRTIADTYGAANVARDIGHEYRLVLWCDPIQVAPAYRHALRVNGTSRAHHTYCQALEAVIVWIPVEADNPNQGIEVMLKQFSDSKC
jgi:hypothetical protein